MDLVRTIAVLSLLIFVHEFGHFLAAKKAGIKVLEFGFGYPPRLFGKKIGETIYSVNLLPVGGFVRLLGEDQEELEGDKGKPLVKDLTKRAFFTQSIRIRTLVVVAGVFMNFLLAAVLFGGLYSVMGIPTASENEVEVIGLAPESPASEVFEVKDLVISIDKIKVYKTADFKSLVDERLDVDVNFEIEREGEKMVVAAIPRSEYPEREGALGVVIAPRIIMMRYPFWQMPFRGIWFGLSEAVAWGRNILVGLGEILLSVLSGVIPEGVGGPFEIHHLISEVSQFGIAALLQLVGILSVNLAIINILPIPALDGGRLAFIVIEAVTGKRLNARAERITNAIGMVFLLALMLAITIHDITRRFELVGPLQVLLERF